MMTKTLTAAPNGGQALSDENAKVTVQAEKLAAEVDRRLAANDPQFAADLRDYQTALASGKQVNGGLSYSFPQDKCHISARLAPNTGKTETSKLNVQLNDPNLKAQCNLSTMGVK